MKTIAASTEQLKLRSPVTEKITSNENYREIRTKTSVV